MDILEKRSMEIASLALDGLAQRHNAIVSNIANADSKNYKRLEVKFEDQLQRIIATEGKKDQHKISNMLNGNNEELKPGKYDMGYSDFQLRISETEDGMYFEGNNVNLEKEMNDLTKNGMKYNALALLQQKAFRGLSEVIKGGMGGHS